MRERVGGSKDPTARHLVAASELGEMRGAHPEDWEERVGEKGEKGKVGGWYAFQVEQQRLLGVLDRDPIAGLGEVAAFVGRAHDGASPGMVYEVLIQAALRVGGEHPEIKGQLLVYAAWSALEAGRAGVALDALALVSADMQQNPWPEPLSRGYERLLATLDRRSDLGLYALRVAHAAPDPEKARDLFVLARALFVSCADPVNVAVADYNRARLEFAQGQTEAARFFLKQGMAFERAAHFEPLRLFREQIEAEFGNAAQ